MEESPGSRRSFLLEFFAGKKSPKIPENPRQSVPSLAVPKPISPRTYRLRNIPHFYTEGTLVAALTVELRLLWPASFKIRSLSAGHTMDDDGRPFLVATMDCKGLQEGSLTASVRPQEWRLILGGHGFKNETEPIEVLLDTHFLGFTPLSPSTREYEVDCIAIHGWGSHAFGGFKAPGQNFMWLRDRLPKDIPTLRVWTYGYDYNLQGDYSIANMDEHADTFRRLLIDMRRNTQIAQHTPLIFIAHSLGGLVLKEAFIGMAAKTGDLPYSSPMESTTGIAFFGVPSQGMAIGKVPAMIGDRPQRYDLTRLDKAVGYRPRSAQHEAFCKSFHYHDAKIIQFFETRKTADVEEDPETKTWSRSGPASILVSPESATICGREWETTKNFKISLHTDHTGLVKFGHGDDEKYPLVRMELEKLAGNACDILSRRPKPASVENQYTHVTEQDEAEIMSALFDKNVSTGGNSTSRIDGTCHWILEDPVFAQWKALSDSDGPHDLSRLLWITGAPGTGKTVLSNFILQELRSERPNAAICWFSSNGGKTPAITMMRSMLLQQFRANKRLLAHPREELRIKGKEFGADWDTLCDVWLKCCRDTQAVDTIWVIDALDEWDITSKERFVEQLKQILKLLRSSPTRSRFKVVITSRVEKEIQSMLSEEQPNRINLDDKIDNLTSDIEKVIDRGVADLVHHCFLPERKVPHLTEKLRDQADKTFLWVTLILKMLRKSEHPHTSWDSVIETLPAGLDDTYDKLLEQIPIPRRPETKVIFQLIIAASEPLTIADINLLLEMRRNPESDVEISDMFTNSNPEIKAMPFLRIINEKFVHFVHKSASDFLLSNQESIADAQDRWYATNNLESQSEIAERCITLLKLIGTSVEGLAEWRGGENADFEDYANKSDHTDLLSYAATNWAWHFQQSEVAVVENNLLQQEALSLYTQPFIFLTWSQLYWAARLRQPRKFSPLHMAAYNGHAVVVSKMMEKEGILSQRDSKNDKGDTPLHLAAGRGYPKVIDVLHKCGADLRARDNSGMMPLHRAVEEHHKDAVEVLLDCGSNVDAKEKDGSTALHRAARAGDLDMIKLLLDRHATLETIDLKRMTAADCAFEKGHGSVHHLLLEKQVDPGITDLDQAVIDDDLEEVKKLIEEGAGLNATDHRGLSPLHHAARGNNAAIVRYLLDKGVAKELEDEDGYTALHLAARRGREDVVAVLLSYKLNVNSKSKNGSTPLHEASCGGNVQVVSMLLDGNSDLDTANDEGKTSLYCAAGLNYPSIVRILVNRGAKVDIKDMKGRVALHEAARNGHIKVVQVIAKLMATFEVECRDIYEATPLSLAARGETKLHGEVVAFLLEHGANARCSERDSSTPLLLAAEAGNIAAMKHLMKRLGKDDLDRRNADRNTPIGLAAARDHEDAVVLLLEIGAEDVVKETNICTKDQFGDCVGLAAMHKDKRAVVTGKGAVNTDNKAVDIALPPLSWCAMYGQLQAVRKLLEFSKIDVNMAGIDESRPPPLALAAANGHLAVVRCLLQSGKAEIDLADKHSRTPLSYAAGGGYAEVVSLLLESGADQACRDTYGQTPICWAAGCGHLQVIKNMRQREAYLPTTAITNTGHTLLSLACSQGHEIVVRYLLEQDHTVLNETTRFLSSPLMKASAGGYYKIVQHLLSFSEIEVHAKTKEGVTALLLALQFGHSRIVDCLIEHDPKVLNVLTEKNMTPLMSAAGEGHYDIAVKLLQLGADSQLRDRSDQTALHWAAFKGHLIIVNLFLLEDNRPVIDSVDANGSSLLLAAAAGGHEAVVSVLLKRIMHCKLDKIITQKGNGGNTPLMAAVLAGHTGTVRVLLQVPDFIPEQHEHISSTLLTTSLAYLGQHGLEISQMLLSLGLELDTPDRTHIRTPLLWASAYGNEGAIKTLLTAKNVSRHATGTNGESALYLAASGGHHASLALLLDNGVSNMNVAETQNGISPLMAAASAGWISIVELLLGRDEVDVNQQDHKGLAALHHAVKSGSESVVIRLCNHSKVNRRIVDRSKRSALAWASVAGYVRIVRFLVELQPDMIFSNDKYGSEPLWYATSNGHLPVVEFLLEKGASFTKHGGYYHRSCLMEACRQGHFNIVHTFCRFEDFEAECNLKDRDGYTPLASAAQLGHAQIVSLMLKHGADPNTQANMSKRTPLMEAAMEGRLDVFRVLVDCDKTNINMENDAGRTALWFVLSYRHSGYVEMANLLLSRNASTDFVDPFGMNALLLAACAYDKKDSTRFAAEVHAVPIVKALLDGDVALDLKEHSHGRNALGIAIGARREGVVRSLLERKGSAPLAKLADDDNTTPLALAARMGELSIVRRLLELKVPVNSPTILERKTPLMFAADGGFDLVVEALLEANADIDAVDKSEYTALFLAARNGHHNVFLQLLNNGARLDVTSKSGSTPLHLAAANGHIRIVQTLIQMLAISAKIRDRQGRTPILWAASNGFDRIVRHLLPHSDLEIRDTQEKSPLTWATITGTYETVSLLIDEGAKTDVLDRNGRSLLSHAAERGHLAIIHLLLSLPLATDLQDKAGRTALSWAAEQGQIASVRCLLDNKADPSLVDNKKMTPEMYALDNDYAEVAELLKKSPQSIGANSEAKSETQVVSV